jgi:hypothetical protein
MPGSVKARAFVSYFGNENVSTKRAPKAGAPSGRMAQYLAIAAMLVGWFPIIGFSTQFEPAPVALRAKRSPERH